MCIQNSKEIRGDGYGGTFGTGIHDKDTFVWIENVELSVVSNSFRHLKVPLFFLFKY